MVAVSPQTPDNSLSTAQKNDLVYPVLSDSGLAAASAFGVAFEMPPDLIDLYSPVGNDLPRLNGNGCWVFRCRPPTLSIAAAVSSMHMSRPTTGSVPNPRRF